MSEFVYLFRGGDRPSSPEAMQKQMQKWVAWMKELGEKGHIKNPGAPLERTGKTVKGKDRTVVDGPFAETKDIVGGFIAVEARDMQEAVELAHGCPILGLGGDVEVRPVMALKM